jgi:hypothetical protein
MAWQSGAMVAARRIIVLSVDADQRRALVEISRSCTESANRVGSGAPHYSSTVAPRSAFGLSTRAGACRERRSSRATLRQPHGERSAPRGSLLWHRGASHPARRGTPTGFRQFRELGIDTRPNRQVTL